MWTGLCFSVWYAESMRKCLYCQKLLSKRFQVKYCSNRCQVDAQYKTYIFRWKSGAVDGNRGIRSENISGHIKKYLLEKFKSKCSLCGWGKEHPMTGNVPLEIDHVDGDASNNLESNIRLLCPNCHALTSNFKNLNRGRGRKWRREKYIKN